MYDGAEAGTSREYEKTARTFSKIYGSYYPLVETVYRGGSSTAAWTVTNAYDAFGRVVTRNDSRAGNSCVYYLYNGAAGSAAFSYPYTAPAGWDLYTAFGVAGGTAREAVSGVYHRTYYEYDGSLNVTRELVRELAADGSAMPDATTQYSYDPDTNVLMSVTTPTGEEIELTYGNGWKSSYVCRDMRLLSASPVRYFRTDADYDLRGRLIYRRLYMADSTHQPVLDGRYPGGCAYFHYDGLGRLRLLFKAETDPDQGWPNHKILRVEYDDENRTVLKTDARGYQVLTRYDPFFRPVDRYTYKPMDETCTMDYNGWKRTELTHVRYSYDPAQVGLLLEETAFLGASDTDPLAARYGYDTLGRPTKAERVRSGNPITLREAEYSDATNTVLTRSYRSASEYTAVEIDRDWLGRPERESAWTEAGQAGTRLDTLYAYDPGGRLAAKTLPNGEVYSYAYTSAGRLTKTTYPNGRGEETRTYDLSGRLVASTDLNGSVTSLSYNPAGQLAGKTVSRNSVTEETVETTYCPHGPLTVTKYLGSSSVPEISSEYAYKFDGSVRRETRTVHIDGNPVASFVERELDDAGNLLGVTVSGLSGFRKTVRYSLPGFGEAVPGVDGYSVTARGESGGTIATSASTRLGRAVLAYGNGQVTAYSYDDWLGLAGIDNPGTAYDQSYARDYTGKIAEWTNHVGTRAFAYDGLGRLASGEGVAYGYDPAGNMTTAVNGDPSAFQYQTGSTGQNSMLIDATTGAQTGTVDYSTDPEGNVVQAASRFGAIGYDFSNRITSIADMARGVTDEYSYDQAGLRYRKDETVDGREIRTFTTYSGNDIVLEETFHGGGWETARIEVFVDGMNIGRFEKDYRTDPDSESLKYYYRDHLGSRIGVADEAGAVLATVSYDAWGNAAATGADGYDAEGEIRFTGKPRDATGLYYFNARYYDPQSKRFFTEDPIQSWMNWYAYCGNDPVNYTDPEGKEYYGHGNGDLKGGDRDIKIKDAGNKSPRELGRERDRQRVIGGSGPLVYSKKSGYILRSGWQDPNNKKTGMGWRTSVMEDDKKHFMNYGHLDPESTLSPGSKVEEGAPIGRMANPTNGRSSGPHVHVERRNANDGTEVHPGNESPYAGRSRRTSGYGDIDSMHSTPHSGVDHVPAADKVFDGNGNVYGL